MKAWNFQNDTSKKGTAKFSIQPKKDKGVTQSGHQMYLSLGII
jgi:hypothetical protein